MAPSRSDRDAYGMISDSSYSSVAPKPLHRLHAPRGLLNEKSCGVGDGARVPSLGHSNRSVNRALRVPRNDHGLGKERDAIAVAFAKRRADRFGQTPARLVAHRETVHDDEHFL